MKFSIKNWYSEGQFRVIPKRTIPTSWYWKICLGLVFRTIYDFGSIQLSDTLMSDGYFNIFLTDESNRNVSEISIDPSSELIVSIPNIDK